jgi:hypothetical protein
MSLQVSFVKQTLISGMQPKFEEVGAGVHGTRYPDDNTIRLGHLISIESQVRMPFVLWTPWV